MSKITKKQLQHSVDLLNKENSSQHNYLMRIKRALKSIDIDILSDKFDEPKPQLKQLDQSVFDGLDEKWKFAAINIAGRLMLSKSRMVCCERYWRSSASSSDLIGAGDGYDASNWQNSLIERDKVELTGSDLCRAMLERGDKYVMCFVSGMSDARADSIPKAITSFNLLTGQFRANHDRWQYAVPINNQGEPLTAAEAGF